MKNTPKAQYFLARRSRLLAAMKARRVAELVISNPANLFYLTGFRGSAGAAIFEPRGCLLLVDPRYTIQASKQAQGVEVLEVKSGLLNATGRLLRKRRVRKIMFEDTHLTMENFSRLRKEGPANASWLSARGMVEQLRIVKDEMEVGQIKAACLLTSEAFTEVLSLVRPGISEREIASEVDFRMRHKGAEGTAFETIVASGPRAALPHARPTDKQLKPGELVILDLGAILGGYTADLTRTICIGPPGKRAQALYQAVLEAQQQAVDTLRAGVTADEVDGVARNSLASRGFDRYFTHSTGHGVGIEIHERPRVGRGETAPLQAGSVVTVEPGVYIEGFGGVRIEDTVLVGAQGPEILTSAPKDLSI